MPSARDRHGFTAALADLVLPRDCAGCARPGRHLCPACRRHLSDGPGIRRGVWAAPTLPIAFAAHYRPPASTILLAFKEQGRRALAGDLGAALAGAVMAAREGGCGHHPRDRSALVSIPSTPAALARRGEDVAALIVARAVAELATRGQRFRHRPVLTGIRGRFDQAGLDAAARRRNLEGAFRARRALAETCVIVVDDVVTTGATLGAAVAALEAVGIPCCAAAVVLATGERSVRRIGLPPPSVGITVKGGGREQAPEGR